MNNVKKTNNIKKFTFITTLTMILFLVILIKHDDVKKVSAEEFDRKTIAEFASNDMYGTKVKLGTYKGKDLNWTIVGFKEIDGKKCPLLVLDNFITAKIFEDYGNNASDLYDATNILGNNRWATSNIRTWLNSNKEGSNIDYRTSIYKNINGPYEGEDGFLSTTNFKNAEYNVIKQVKLESFVGSREKYFEMYEGGSASYDYSNKINYDLIDTFYTRQSGYFFEYTYDKVFLLGIDELKIAFKGLDNNNNFKHMIGAQYYLRIPNFADQQTMDLRIMSSSNDFVYDTISINKIPIRPVLYLDPDIETEFVKPTSSSVLPYFIPDEVQNEPIIEPASVTTGNFTQSNDNAKNKVCLEATINNFGGAKVIEAGFYVADTKNKLNSTDASKFNIRNTSGINEAFYKIEVSTYNGNSALVAGTKYYYRSYVISETSAGNQETILGVPAAFTPGVPIINTSMEHKPGESLKSRVNIVSASEVYVYGRLVSNMGQTILEKGIDYVFDGDYHYSTICEDDYEDGLNVNKFKVVLPGDEDNDGSRDGELYFNPSQETKYRCRAYVIYDSNGNGIKDNADKRETGAYINFVLGGPSFKYIGIKADGLTNRLTSALFDVQIEQIKGTEISNTYFEYAMSRDDLNNKTGSYKTVAATYDADTKTMSAMVTDIIPGFKYTVRACATNEITEGKSEYAEFYRGRSSLFSGTLKEFSNKAEINGFIDYPTEYEESMGYALDSFEIECSTNYDFNPSETKVITSDNYIIDGNNVYITVPDLDELTRYYLRIKVNYIIPSGDIMTTIVNGDYFTFITKKRLSLKALNSLKAPVPGEVPITSFDTREYSAVVNWFAEDGVSAHHLMMESLNMKQYIKQKLN